MKVLRVIAIGIQAGSAMAMAVAFLSISAGFHRVWPGVILGGLMAGSSAVIIAAGRQDRSPR